MLQKEAGRDEADFQAADSGPATPASSGAATWLLHCLFLLLALAAVRVVVGPGIFTIDENAYRWQAQKLEATGEWISNYPTDELLDQQTYAPLVLGPKLDTGWIAYSRHPVYVRMLVGSRALSDQDGPVAVSIVSVVIIALALARVSSRFGDVDWRFVLWGVGLASPFLIHSQIVWAHAPAAAAFAVAAAVFFNRGPPPVHELVAGVFCIVLLMTLRTEGVLAGLALGVGALFMQVPRLRRAATFSAIGVAAFAGVVLDRFLMLSVLAGSVPTTTPNTGSTSFVRERAEAVVSLLLEPGGESVQGLARLVSALLFVAAVVWAYKRQDASMTAVLSVFAGITGVIGSLIVSAYSGLLPAVPLLVVGLVGAAHEPRFRPFVVAAGVIVVGVFGTSYTDGGGLGWGGRYMLLALVLVVPVVAAGLKKLPGRPGGAVLLVAALVVTLSIQVAGVRVLRRNHVNSEIVAAQATEVLSTFEGTDRLLVATDIRVGRLVPDAVQRVPLLSIGAGEQLPDALRLAAEAGVSDVTLVAIEGNPELPIPDGWELVASESVGSIQLTDLRFVGTP